MLEPIVTARLSEHATTGAAKIVIITGWERSMKRSETEGEKGEKGTKRIGCEMCEEKDGYALFESPASRWI